MSLTPKPAWLLWHRAEFSGYLWSRYGMLLVATLWWPICATAVDSFEQNYWQLPIPVQGTPSRQLLWPTNSIQASDCALCHPKQFDEWKTSLHANAASPGLLGQLEAFDEETRHMCLNCHAPRREQQLQLDFQSADFQTGGVDCASCHLRAHQRFGPRDAPLTPHGQVLAEPLFWSVNFCAPCHQFEQGDVAVNGKFLENTVEEWRVSAHAKRDVTCQDCHMPEGSHNFRGIHDADTIRRGLDFVVKRTPDGITATVSNHGAGHALPTYITPRLRVILKTPLDKIPAELIIQRAMSWDEDNGWRELFDTRLLPEQSRHIRLKLKPQEQATASIIVEPDADYHDRVYPILIDRLRSKISTQALDQLETAHAAAGSSAYTAFSVNCGPARSETYRCE